MPSYESNTSVTLLNCIVIQVFGELIENCQSDAQQNSVQRGSSDLKEHMVGILFSRRKLNNLQKQVIALFTFLDSEKIMFFFFKRLFSNYVIAKNKTKIKY